jgi:uncharacterized BrkB/YihY/UPF0761 family membrane protein
VIVTSPTEPDAAPEPPQPGRVARTRRRVDALRSEVERRAIDLEGRVPLARTVFNAYRHDRQVGGEIMAGAIAFRMFVFILPLVLVLVAGLGVFADADEEGTPEVARQFGIGGIAARSVAESARLDHGGRAVALALGLFALYFASVALARALRIAHALAWQEAIEPLRKPWRAAGILIGVILSVMLIFSLVSRVREIRAGFGVIGMVSMLAVYAAAWFLVSLLLPHRRAPWTALLPGAAVFAFGVEILHLVTVYYLTRRVSTSTSLYGPVGAAISILLWAYLFGRLTVAAAVVNATLWNRKSSSTRETADALPEQRDEDHE